MLFDFKSLKVIKDYKVLSFPCILLPELYPIIGMKLPVSRYILLYGCCDEQCSTTSPI